MRWYHSNDRKWRGTEEPLDEGERGEKKKQKSLTWSSASDNFVFFFQIILTSYIMFFLI